MTRSYRVTFLKDLSVNYWAKKGDPRPTFRDVHLRFYSLVRLFKIKSRQLKIKQFWHFYEPFIEITWISDEKQANALHKFIKLTLKKLKIKDLKFEKGKPPEGFGRDWFSKSEKEEEFGGKRHALCSDLVDLFYEYHEPIEAGYGLNEQVGRCIHTICNPLGLNYHQEARICLSRGLLCLLLTYFGQKWAVWMYVKVFRQRLPK